MAFQLPRPEEVGGARWPHGWYSYESYKAVHSRYMMTLLNEGLIEKDNLRIEEIREGRTLKSVFVRGCVKCCNGVMVRVDKELAVQKTRSGYDVKGCDYSYHAWLSATGQEILRYDMAHEWAGLHCHLFDPKTGREQVTPANLDELPSLDAFIRIAIKRAEEF